MHRIRKRLTYANVMSSIAVFLVLGGAAVAATQLPKNSVGTKQLKRNAVTAAKIKKNAVTSAKIKRNAVTSAKIAGSAVNGGKIADGSVTGVDINAESTPFGHVVAKLRGSTGVSVTETFQAFSLSPSTYTQGAEEDDMYNGALDVTFQPGCEAPRRATAFVLIDPTNAITLEPSESIAAWGVTEDKTSGTVTQRIQLSPYVLWGSRFEPGSAKSHTVSLVVEGECNAGNGIVATTGAVDVIGTK